MALLIAVVGGLNAAFQPMLHSSRRRHDMNESRRLFDAFRAEIARGQNDTQKLVQIFQNYANLFAGMYSARGQRLTDSITQRESRQPDKEQERLT